MRAAAHATRVTLVTGDTKVVDRGKGDGLFVNTAGVGVVAAGIEIAPARVRAGDAIIVNGDVGRHGIAVLSVREGLRFGGDVASDCAPLAGVVRALLAAGIETHCLRDLTRGGLASALNEIAMDGGVDIGVDERAIPVSEPVAAACEILGLDPLYVACEGRFVAFVPAAAAGAAVEIMRAHPAGHAAARIGTVRAAGPGTVCVTGRLGTERILDLLSGEQLPRIC
jgi:hydrogenase expression/formation protein HypE